MEFSDAIHQSASNLVVQSDTKSISQCVSQLISQSVISQSISQSSKSFSRSVWKLASRLSQSVSESTINPINFAGQFWKPLYWEIAPCLNYYIYIYINICQGKNLGFHCVFQLSTLAGDCLILISWETITWFCRSMAACFSCCICDKLMIWQY